MDMKCIQIGEHLFELSCNSIKLMMFIKSYFCFTTSLTPSDAVIHIREGYGSPFVNYEVVITKEENKLYFQRADYRIEIDTLFQYASISVYDEFALKHALMNFYSAFIVYHQWGLLIHSSCIVEHKQAHIFAGQSGAGKSTVARLSHPRDLLSDEATIVKISPMQIRVFDSPFRSEIVPTDLQESKPLGSIQLLYQANQNERKKLKKTEALFNLIGKVFYWSHSSTELRKIFTLLNILVNEVEMYELHFQKNNTFWELIS